MSHTRIFFVALILSYTGYAGIALAEPKPIEWSTIRSDLEQASLTVHPNILKKFTVTLFRTRLKELSLRVLEASDFSQKRLEVKNFCNLSKAILCINANFFDEEGKPLGLIVSRGMVKHPLHKGGKTLTGVFFVKKSGFGILNRADVSLDGIREGVQAGPRILSAGEEVVGLKESKSSKRSGICIDSQNRLIFYVVEGDWFGVTNSEVIEVLQRKDINCVDALNLDGGSSSQIYLTPLAGRTGYHLVGEDSVPVALGLFEGKDTL